MTDLPRFLNTVGGQRIAASGGATLETFDPFTGRPWANIPRCNAADVDAAVGSARRAFDDPAWRGLNPTARGKLLVRLADLIAVEAERLAAIEVQDNGKLMSEMVGQLRYIPEWYRYFGGLADKVEGRVLPIDKAGMHAYTRREPLGVVACITPWNSPLLLLTWKLAPALAAGNTTVVKPSEHASASTLEFLQLFERAGFPPGVVNSVTGLPAEVGVPLVQHPGVDKIAFTGGDSAGVGVYHAAADTLKHLSLELGGKSPNIIFADAKLPDAVNGAISGIFAASGQTCIAGSRLLVQRSVHDETVERLVKLAKTARIGDPKLSDTQVGPVTTSQQRRRILDYIALAQEGGAQCVLGGRAPAVAIANDSPYGLAAGVWTTDMGRALRMSERLKAGTVWINCYRAVSFMAPFGGYKRSGLGRENGSEAIDAYLQTKTVWIDAAGQVANPFVIR